jgi:hypothetical protein
VWLTWCCWTVESSRSSTPSLIWCAHRRRQSISTIRRMENVEGRTKTLLPYATLSHSPLHLSAARIPGTGSAKLRGPRVLSYTGRKMRREGIVKPVTTAGDALRTWIPLSSIISPTCQTTIRKMVVPRSSMYVRYHVVPNWSAHAARICMRETDELWMRCSPLSPHAARDFWGLKSLVHIAGAPRVWGATGKAAGAG